MVWNNNSRVMMNQSIYQFAQQSFAAKNDKSKKEDKKQKEKEEVHQQFEGKDLNTVKSDFEANLDVSDMKVL